ncbi:MAG TPA: peptidoglycan-binding protein [Lacipirellulaceae bacterium]|jgi:peptidoglycan hydrolase-like protein with peptidoglycan-binding domain
MNNKRIVFLAYLLAIVALVAVMGWAVGSHIESPAEAAARTAPPTPSPILVPVEKRVLSSKVVTRGTARFGLPQPISIAPSALKGSAGLITKLPVRNAQFKEGDVLFSASGRPVLVLQGDVPAYRDLVPGISGEDVRQLEQGLERLGYDPGHVDGVYDDQTGAAVAKWYSSLGWDPYGPTAAQTASVRALELALGDANRSKMAATNTSALGGLSVASARLKTDYGTKSAEADISAKIAERAFIVLDPKGLQTARSAADAKLELARAALKSAKLDGQLTNQMALDAQKLALLDAKIASERADQLAVDLEVAKHRIGIGVPVDEIVFIPALPVRVQEVVARVGSPASGPVLTVTDNQIAIDSSLPLDEAQLVKPGMTVDIDEQALGIKTTGTVEMVDSTPGTHGIDGYHIYYSVRVGAVQTPLEGFSLRLTIPIKSTQGIVTTVPISALSLAADGTSRIQVQNNGALESIVVEPGLSADGFVEVKPTSGELKPDQLVVVGYGSKDNKDLQP